MNIEALLGVIRTPFKVDELLIRPSFKKGDFDSHGVDCPFPFFHEGAYWMTYVGFDGEGYQAGLARSDDLLTWEKKGLILGRGEKGSITEFNCTLTCIMRDNELFGPATLKKVDGKYIGTYHAYPDPGYEEGPGVIGICYTEDLENWEMDPPCLQPDPACSWEAGGLYKPYIIESEGTYYLFYNAKDHTEGDWIEQTGFATSTDLIHWERSKDNPVLPVGKKGEFDDHFASDPFVLKHENTWIMFYFGLCTDGHAREGAAFSDDLLHWEKSNEILVDTGAEGSIDSRFAHKPGIITKDGKLYHFYCAVAPVVDKQQGEIEHGAVRGIALATGE